MVATRGHEGEQKYSEIFPAINGHWSHVTPHITPHITHHTLHHTSYHTSHLTSHLTRHITRHTSPVTLGTPILGLLWLKMEDMALSDLCVSIDSNAAW